MKTTPAKIMASPLPHLPTTWYFCTYSHLLSVSCQDGRYPTQFLLYLLSLYSFLDASPPFISHSPLFASIAVLTAHFPYCLASIDIQLPRPAGDGIPVVSSWGSRSSLSLRFFFCGWSAVLRPSVHMLPGSGWCGAGLPPFLTALSGKEHGRKTPLWHALWWRVV